MINEDAPTMSAGNGGFSGSAAATGPVAGFDPLLGSGKVKKRKYKRKEVKEDASDRYGKSNYLPFLISYDGAEASRIIKILKPSVVIPVHFARGKEKIENCDLEGLFSF